MKSPIAKLSRNVQIDKNVAALLQSGTAWNDYAVDFAQRAILFGDTMRQRGNDFREHQKKGLPPLLHFEYENVLDARKFTRPVNYTLLCIIPPKGVTVDPKRRPYVVIDPRAGQACRRSHQKAGSRSCSTRCEQRSQAEGHRQAVTGNARQGAGRQAG